LMVLMEVGKGMITPSFGVLLPLFLFYRQSMWLTLKFITIPLWTYLLYLMSTMMTTIAGEIVFPPPPQFPHPL